MELGHPHSYRSEVLLDAGLDDVFAYVDDHAQFSGHMNRSSWMMAGGRMETSADEGQGRTVGSHIRMTGRVVGVKLELDEVITVRDPPSRKAWETVGEVRLLVIGHYQMSLELEPEATQTRLVVAIDYDLPTKNAWLGRLFGKVYAMWCVRQMLQTTRAHFSRERPSARN